MWDIGVCCNFLGFDVDKFLLYFQSERLFISNHHHVGHRNCWNFSYKNTFFFPNFNSLEGQLKPSILFPRGGPLEWLILLRGNVGKGGSLYLVKKECLILRQTSLREFLDHTGGVKGCKENHSPFHKETGWWFRPLWREFSRNFLWMTPDHYIVKMVGNHHLHC